MSKMVSVSVYEEMSPYCSKHVDYEGIKRYLEGRSIPFSIRRSAGSCTEHVLETNLTLEQVYEMAEHTDSDFSVMF